MSKKRKKKQNPYVVFLRSFVITAVLVLALLAGSVAVLDPFYHYHGPILNMKAVLSDKEYQVIGTLRNFDYNAVLVGSSVVENNDNSWYDEAFGVKTVKAVRSYGGIADLCWFLEEAYRAREAKGETIERVFFNIDPASLLQDDVTTFESTGCPMYLYDENPINDVQYLWNKTVLFEKIPYQLAQSFSGSYNENLSYNWAEGKNFSTEGALSQYTRKTEIAEAADPAEYEDKITANLLMLRRVIEAHPETEFIFFIPPYSQLWWDDAVRSGLKDVYLQAEKTILEGILPHENVRAFDFQNETSITWNLNYYMDTVHFSPEINHLMVQYMKEGICEVTIDQVEETVRLTGQLCEEGQIEVIGALEQQGAWD